MQKKAFLSLLRFFSVLGIVSIISSNISAQTITIDSTKNVSCNGLSDGAAYITVTGGSSPYDYSWSNTSTDEDATGLQAGTYTITVTDAAFSVTTETVTITEPLVLGGAPGANDATCNGANDGSATIAPSGGTSPYYYSWSPGGQTTQTATGLAPNTYTVDVTDALGCTYSATLSIGEPSAFSHTITPTHITCNGDNDGQASVNITGGTPLYTYAWAPSGGTDASATGLAPGNYTVNVTDQNSCPYSATVTITEPSALTSTITASSNVTCNGLNNGSATVGASGGTGTYTYAWAPSGGTNATAAGLNPNTYTVTVTDDNSCATTNTVTITQPSALTSTITASSNVTCNGLNNGSATVGASGGTGTYTYAWAPSGGTNATATSLSPNTYTVTVTDDNSCATTNTITITQPSALTSTITASSNVTCNGLNNGSATVGASGGTGTYTYAWTPSGGTNATATNLSPNTYTITVTDNNGCTSVKTATITQPAVLTSTITSNNVTCNGLNNGTATIAASGGTTAYTYAWAPSGGTNATATNLSPNTYTVTVTDNNGCTSVKTATITQPAVLSATTSVTQHVSCNTGTNGIVTVTVTGGNTPYTYSWAPSGGTNATASNLSANTYTVTVTDNKSCTTTGTVTVTQPSAITLTVSATNTVSCFGGSNGAASVNAAGGVGSYSYSWAPSGGTNTTATNLTAGNYTVSVSDGNSCVRTGTVNISQAPEIIISSISSSQANCGQSDGSVSVTASGGTGSLSYSWNPSGGTDANVTGLGAGSYTVTITDGNSCTKTGNVTVANAAGFSVSISSFTNASCNGICDGSIATTLTAGTSPFTYSWSNGDTTANITGLCDGVYSLTVTDAVSCISIISQNISEPNPLVLSISGTGAICRGQSIQLTASATGGTGAYTYAWTPGGSTTDTLTVSPTITSTYTLNATDSMGCIASAVTGTVTVRPVLSVNINGTPICIGNNTTLTAAATGGDGNYSYTWSPGGQTTSAINVAPTLTSSYTVTVTDNCGSTAASGVYTLTVNPLPVVSFSVDIASGCEPLQTQFTNTSNPSGTIWAWTFGDGNSSSLNNPSHTYTNAGQYSVTLTVTDANNCSNSSSVSNMITVHTLPLASFTVTPTTGGPQTEFVFTNTSTGATKYTWHLGDAANTTDTTTNPSFTYGASGTYTITLIAENTNGCKDTAWGMVTVEDDEFFLFVPSAFSPNGDGKNETFGPRGSGIDPNSFHFFVYDRWGILVFYTQIWGNDWDGKVDWPMPIGKTAKEKVQQDIFMWKVLVKDLKGEEHEQTGTVIIVK